MLDAFVGKQVPVAAAKLKWLSPRVPLTLSTTDENGKAIPARLSIIDSRGRFLCPPDAWVQADDSRPSLRATEPHYVHSSGKITLQVPKDSIFITASASRP